MTTAALHLEADVTSSAHLTIAAIVHAALTPPTTVQRRQSDNLGKMQSCGTALVHAAEHLDGLC
eukprot:2037-Heterococcus_DN1.PRE.4